MAAQPLLLVLVFSLGLCLCVKSEYQFFQMVQQWGPAKCSDGLVQCHAQPQPMFTIHGLWPSNYTNLYLQYCSTQAFEDSKVAKLLPDLTQYWPDLEKGEHRVFWEHEWNKHGTCSIPPFDVFEYFQLALNIRKHKNYDLLAILSIAGLGPAASERRKYKDIVSAIEAATGKKPWLRCNKNDQTKMKQLWEIVLCFGHDGATPIHCPPLAKTCPSDFDWFPQQSLISAAKRRNYLDYFKIFLY